MPASEPHPALTIELGVKGIGYDDDAVLPVGEGGGGGDEQDEDADEADEQDVDDESVLSVRGADGERVAQVVTADDDETEAVAEVPVGWIELSLWPR